MRHHPHHVSLFVDQRRDVVQRPVGIGSIAYLPGRRAVTQHHAAVALQMVQLVGRDIEAPFIVSYGHAKHLSRLVGAGEGQVGALGSETHRAADELEPPIAKHGAGKQACLLQDLKSVADPQHEATAASELLYRLHHGGEPGDSSRPEIVPVRKAPGKHYEVAVVQMGISVPYKTGIRAENMLQDMVGIMVAVRSGKHHDASLHAGISCGHSIR